MDIVQAPLLFFGEIGVHLGSDRPNSLSMPIS
jgi:hypothetical protein